MQSSSWLAAVLYVQCTSCGKSCTCSEVGQKKPAASSHGVPTASSFLSTSWRVGCYNHCRSRMRASRPAGRLAKAWLLRQTEACLTYTERSTTQVSCSFVLSARKPQYMLQPRFLCCLTAGGTLPGRANPSPLSIHMLG